MRLLYLHNRSLDAEEADIIHAFHICQAFSELGVDITLALPNSGMEIENIKSFTKNYFGISNSFPITFFPRYMIKGRLISIGCYWGVKKLLKRTSADLCYVRDPLFLYLSLKFGFRTIFESHNLLLHERSVILDKFWRRKLLKLIKTKNCIKFVAISSALAEKWKELGVPARKCLALHDGFDMKLFETPKTRFEMRKKLNLPTDQKLVVYTGNLHTNRGIEHILKLAARLECVKFLVVGGPENQKKYYNNLATKQNIKNIFFQGSVPHRFIPDYLFAADVLLMIWSRQVPTINYCSPLKVFEYMAAERIIVGHGFPTIKEVLVDGKTAYLADPDSFDDLLKKTKKALLDEYPSEMAVQARRLAFNKFPWIVRAKQILHSVESRT